MLGVGHHGGPKTKEGQKEPGPTKAGKGSWGAQNKKRKSQKNPSHFFTGSLIFFQGEKEGWAAGEKGGGGTPNGAQLQNKKKKKKGAIEKPGREGAGGALREEGKSNIQAGCGKSATSLLREGGKGGGRRSRPADPSFLHGAI